MGGMAGLIAGVATIGAGLALYRFIDRKARDTRSTLEQFRRRTGDGPVLDYARDPDDGVYRRKA